MTVTADEMVVTDRSVPDSDETAAQSAQEPSFAGDRPVCQEPGCDQGCRARRNHPGEYLPYCTAHNKLHANEGGTPTSRTPRNLTAARQASSKRIENNLNGWLGLVQMGLATSGDQYCAWAIGEEGPYIAQSLGELAQDYPLLKRVLESGDKAGTLAVLIWHLGRLGLMVATHHDWVPWEGPIRFLVPQPPARHQPQPPPQQYAPSGYEPTNVATMQPVV